MTAQNTNGNRPRSANGFIDMVVVGNHQPEPAAAEEAIDFSYIWSLTT